MGTGILSRGLKWPGTEVERSRPPIAMVDEWANTQLPLCAFIA
jgi:hypothetical protein